MRRKRSPCGWWSWVTTLGTEYLVYLLSRPSPVHPVRLVVVVVIVSMAVQGLVKAVVMVAGGHGGSPLRRGGAVE